VNTEQAQALRAAFPPEQIGKLPRAGVQLDYVGHAAVTDRLLAVDPEWTWEPVAWAEDGGPLIRYGAKDASLWIRLTVCGVTRLGVGTAAANAFDLEKQLISDALRNAAMRFGVALDLWSRQDLHDQEHAPPTAGPLPDAGGEPTVGDYGTWVVRDLAAECAKRGLAPNGTKAALVARLYENDRDGSPTLQVVGDDFGEEPF
jgi:hypothetical protein